MKSSKIILCDKNGLNTLKNMQSYLFLFLLIQEKEVIMSADNARLSQNSPLH